MNRYSYETECEGKRRHRNKRAAKLAVKGHEQVIHERLQPYRCSWCGWFHIGHRVHPAWKTQPVDTDAT